MAWGLAARAKGLARRRENNAAQPPQLRLMVPAEVAWKVRELAVAEHITPGELLARWAGMRAPHK